MQSDEFPRPASALFLDGRALRLEASAGVGLVRGRDAHVADHAERHRLNTTTTKGSFRGRLHANTPLTAVTVYRPRGGVRIRPKDRIGAAGSPRLRACARAKIGTGRTLQRRPARGITSFSTMSRSIAHFRPPHSPAGRRTMQHQHRGLLGEGDDADLRTEVFERACATVGPHRGAGLASE